MKFTIGDPVYIKSNKEEGNLLAFIGKDMAEVSVSGKKYVVFLDDLDHPYLYWFLNKKKETKPLRGDQVVQEKHKSRTSGLDMGIHLVFFPKYRFDGMEDIVDKIRISIYNETWQDLEVNYHVAVKGETLFDIPVRILPETEQYIHDIDFEPISQNPVFTITCTDVQEPAKREVFTFILKGKKLFEQLHRLRFANLASFHHCLGREVSIPPDKIVHKAPPQVVKSEKKGDNHFDFEKAKKMARYEVDLHAEALGLDERRMSSGEILQIQLREAHKALDLAMATHQHELIFIHGVGKGVLKNELHRLLDQTKGGVSYVYTFDSRYGYGATRVKFSY